MSDEKNIKKTIFAAFYSFMTRECITVYVIGNEHYTRLKVGRGQHYPIRPEISKYPATREEFIISGTIENELTGFIPATADAANDLIRLWLVPEISEKVNNLPYESNAVSIYS